jgi:Protein of unknown function (DUF2971)
MGRKPNMEANLMVDQVSKVYPTLHHYTNWGGIEGIIKNQTLWATNVRYLNDTSEYYLAKKPFTRLLHPIVRKSINELSANSQSIKRYVDEHGGLEYQTNELVTDLVRSLYEVSGDDYYVVSFCSEPKDEYVKSHGLLSQWRAYGHELGFAIVFDTVGLENLLAKEGEHFLYAPSHISDVIYSNDEERFENEFRPHFNNIEKYVQEMIASIVSAAAAPTGLEAMTAFNVCTTRYKHRGFCEEAEVRIVAAPLFDTPKFVAEMEKQKLRLKPNKEIKFRTSRGLSAPYLELFGGKFGPLPIQKIIVGPGRNNQIAVELLKKILRGKDIEVGMSELPYV